MINRRRMSGPKNVNSPFHTEISVGRTLGCTVKEKELIHVPRQNLQNLNLSTEDPRNTGVSQWFRESLDELHSAMVKPSRRHPENLVDDENPSHLTICSEALAQQNGELKRWIPPEIPPNYESVVDIKNEKPSGRSAISAWCCAVKVRSDHIICYSPVPEIHKVLVKADLLKCALHCDKEMTTVKLGNWINLICEVRCAREYDDVRPPHFSHVATKICSMPRVKPPVEQWNQRVISNLLQIFLHFDLSKPRNVRRVLSNGEKYFVLNSTHEIPVLVPAKRLDHMVGTSLTAEKLIAFWASRLKRVLKCDMFLIDSEQIVEIPSDNRNV